MIKIILVAGGTAGHLFPAIALWQELKLRNYEVILITDDRCTKYLQNNAELTRHIIDIKINTASLFAKVKSVFAVSIATLKSLYLIRALAPDMVIGFGGYVTLPVILASKVLRLPIIIHEQNSLIGKANIFLAGFANKIAVSYAKTKNIPNRYLEKVIVTGDLIRTNIRNLTPKTNFENPILRILVIGGSQGAQIFSTLIPQSIVLLLNIAPNLAIHVTQQVRREDYDMVSSIYKNLHISHNSFSYNLSDFFYDMDQQYADADLVVARAGASTIAELASICLPAIYIPYPHAAENHQLFNAQAVCDMGGGWYFEQSKVNSSMLAHKILELINDRNMLKNASMSLFNKKTDSCRIFLNTIEKILT